MQPSSKFARLAIIAFAFMQSLGLPLPANANISQLQSIRLALQLGDRQSAADDTLRFIKLHPTDRAGARLLEQVVSAGLPQTLDPQSISILPVTSRLLVTGDGMLITPAGYLPIAEVEPQHQHSFGKICYVYLFDQHKSHLLHLFCRILYTEPSDEAFAKRCGSLLSVANMVYTKQIGYKVPNNIPFSVWLTRDGSVGGEQWQSNLYLYDITKYRSSIEWIREIIHEYSHLALPPIGGYSEPEYWANGYIGERLIVRWISQSPKATSMVEDGWGTFSGFHNFDVKLLAPALSLYRSHPSTRSYLERTDETGMRYLIGQILTIDQKYGSLVLGRVFQGLPKFREARAADITSVLAYTLKAKSKAKT